MDKNVVDSVCGGHKAGENMMILRNLKKPIISGGESKSVL